VFARRVRWAWALVLVPAFALAGDLEQPRHQSATRAAEGTVPRAAPREMVEKENAPVPDGGVPEGSAVPPAPSRSTPAALGPGESVGRPQWWTVGFQSTYVLQRKPGFHADYSGPRSLSPSAETGYTLTGTLLLGLRPWRGTEVFVNPEAIQNQELSNLTGLGGLSNGENQKSGGPLPTAYLARAFLRQTIDLGGERSMVDAEPNQFDGPVASRRIVVTIGKLAMTDVFYGGSFAHDPRTQFLNWALMTYGASDYAADARGYTVGISIEYYRDPWVFRIGRFAQPKESNGLPLDYNILDHYGDSIEAERGYELWGEPGKVSVAGFRNVANMGSFRDALQYTAVHGGIPDVGNVRRTQAKYGFGATLEQNVLPGVGLFARFSFNDGQTETYAFTEIERSVTVGASVKGWHGADALGVAWIANGLSAAHRDYLAAGGLGFFIGDGRLNYQLEQIAEAYCSFNVFRGFWFTVDEQHIVNPAYNADRGPVNIFGLRIHVEY